jgi:hypothetical protein
MEAYGKLVADVAKSLNQFRDENVSVNQARDHLVDSFPDLFKIDIEADEDGRQAVKVRYRDDVDPAQAKSQLQDSFGQAPDDDEGVESELVPAARTQLASSRQQLLATLVLMGINRIVVTDGKISARVMYDFRARDKFSSRTTATNFEYGNQYRHTTSGTHESDTQGAEHSRSRDKDGGWQEDRRDASTYTKGEYKYAAEPVMTLMSVTQSQTDASLDTKAQLAGVVDINFKSDYLPLERMADSFQIAQIQNAAQPASRVQGNGQPPGGRAPSGQAPGGQAPPPGTAVPGGQPAAPARQTPAPTPT